MTRRFPRAQGGVTVLFSDVPNALPQLARDVSIGGMFIETSTPWAEQSRHVVRIVYKDTALQTEVRVARVVKEGMALVFCDESDGLRDQMRSLLMSLFADGAPLDEQRRAPRLEMRTTVRWFADGGEHVSELTDLSRTGARIRVSDSSTPSTDSSIQLYLPVLDASCTEPRGAQLALAKVVRRTQDDFAVHFVHPSQEFLEAIAALRRARRKRLL